MATGSEKQGKLGKWSEKNSLQGNSGNLKKMMKIREKSGNLKKKNTFPNNVKIWKLQTSVVVANRDFFLYYSYRTLGCNEHLTMEYNILAFLSRQKLK